MSLRSSTVSKKLKHTCGVLKSPTIRPSRTSRQVEDDPRPFARDDSGSIPLSQCEGAARNRCDRGEQAVAIPDNCDVCERVVEDSGSQICPTTYAWSVPLSTH